MQKRREKKKTEGTIWCCIKFQKSNADRAEDRNKADIAFYLQLFNNALQTGVAEEDLLHIFRLGRRGDKNNKWFSWQVTPPKIVFWSHYSS